MVDMGQVYLVQLCMTNQPNLNQGYTIVLASDHAGIDLRQSLTAKLTDRGHQTLDIGPHSADSVDYPDFASQAAGVLLSNQADRMILVCGSGIGMSMAANRFVGVRCALVHDELTAELSRQHNNSNAIALGARLTDEATAWNCVIRWLTTPWEGGRHARRINKLDNLT